MTIRIIKMLGFYLGT